MLLLLLLNEQIDGTMGGGKATAKQKKAKKAQKKQEAFSATSAFTAALSKRPAAGTVAVSDGVDPIENRVRSDTLLVSID